MSEKKTKLTDAEIREIHSKGLKAPGEEPAKKSEEKSEAK